VLGELGVEDEFPGRVEERGRVVPTASLAPASTANIS